MDPIIFNPSVRKLAILLVVTVMTQPTKQAATDGTICVSSNTCRDNIGDFECVDEGLDCCLAPNGSLVLLQKPRGTRCCPGTGELYNVSYQVCQNSEIIELPPIIHQCGATKFYNESNDELCCKSDTGESQVHEREYNGLWKCCGKQYVDYNIQGCCNSKIYNRSEMCCVGVELQQVTSPLCQPEVCSESRYCCGGREIEDTIGTICIKNILYARDSIDHSEICLYTDGRQKYRTYSIKEKFCHPTLGPLPREQIDEWCGVTHFDSDKNLCCKGELHTGKSTRTGWRCCPSSVQAYYKDQNICPGHETNESIRMKKCNKKSRKRVIRKMKNAASIIGLRIVKEKTGNSMYRKYIVKDSVLLKGMANTKTCSVNIHLRILFVPKTSCIGTLEKNRQYALVTKEKVNYKTKHVIGPKSVILALDELSLSDLLS